MKKPTQAHPLLEVLEDIRSALQDINDELQQMREDRQRAADAAPLPKLPRPHKDQPKRR
jgi:uncharacterized membrane protein